MKNIKIAVFLAGPPRYVNYVIENVTKKFKGLDYHFFLHLWKTDSGNKIRDGEYFDLKNIRDNPKVKLLLLQQPYHACAYKEKIGTLSNSNSPVFATMGMFLSQNLLCSCLSQLPDFNSFTHIIRLRTDCLLMGDKLINKINFDSDDIYISKNYAIPPWWLSDHIMLTTVKNYFAVWKFRSMQDIYKWYLKGKRNPERTLAARCRNSRLKRKLRFVFERYSDYQIVYNPPKEYEPQWVQNSLRQGNVEEFFKEADRIINSEQSKQLNEKLALEYKPDSLTDKLIYKMREFLLR